MTTLRLVAALACSLPLAALSACVDVDEADPGTEPAFGPPLGGKENNGPYLLGAIPDAIPHTGGYHFRVSPAAMRQGTPLMVNVVHAYLKAGVHEKADPWFVGTVFHHPAGASYGQLRIDAVTASPDAWDAFYTLSYNSNGTPHNWTSYCGAGQYAVPLHGAYEDDDVQVDRAEITFACQDGAAFKCTDWGYDGGIDPQSPYWRTRTACVQAVEAAYDGDGTSYTVTGTPIVMRDLPGTVMPMFTPIDLGMPTSLVVAPPPGVPYFEAAWLPAFYPAAGGIQPPPVCLSKFRWASLAPGALINLGDPRQDPDLRFCEEFSFGELVTYGVFFTRSEHVDAGLWIWRNNASYLTTVDGFWSEIAGDVQAPLTSYGGAVLDSILLRGVPPGHTAAELTEVHLYKSGLKYALSTAAPAGYNPYGSFQGHVWNQPTSNAVPLVLYYNASNSRYFTSATVQPPNGYVAIQTLGYVYTR